MLLLLLVVGEIISMLDASTRVDILNLLSCLKRSGLAILVITHGLSLGNYVSDRTVILRRGAILEMGDTVKVFGNAVRGKSFRRSRRILAPRLAHNPFGNVF